jgi:carboxypeptidase C (cathepsin A)
MHANVFATVLVALAVAPILYAAETVDEKSRPDQDATMLPADARTTTAHSLIAAGGEIEYKATAGTLPVRLDEGEATCAVFYVAYDVEAAKSPTRPLTFVFNGGPGAASAYLHLGALGPKHIVFQNGAGSPAQLADNKHSWLVFSDLVFVDPIGTGYSQCNAPKRDSDNEKPTQQSESRAWGVRADLKALSRFIRLYLTRNQRWVSPKFLVGESYGGLRAAALTEILPSEYGIELAGVVLVSPALEFGLLRGDPFTLLPWILPLPSYAASARFHRNGGTRASSEANPRSELASVEDFAIRQMLPAMAAGEVKALGDTLAGYTGLPPQRIAELKGRIPPVTFVKELLREQGKILSLYDASWVAIDPEPSNASPPREDPLLARLNSRLTAAFNSYVRRDLRFETDLPYEVLNKKVARKWNWRSGLDEAQGFVGVADNLKVGMTLNDQLKVLVAHGVFDLVTPYLGSVILARQLELDPVVASNLVLRVYQGGHMFYTHTESRAQFYLDGSRLFDSARQARKRSSTSSRATERTSARDAAL